MAGHCGALVAAAGSAGLAGEQPVNDLRDGLADGLADNGCS